MSGESVDAFLRGRFRLVQPRRGHRSGLDALLLAASIPAGATGRLLDLGSGSGAVAFAALTRCPHMAATLVEIDPAAAGRARRGPALNAHLAGRVEVVEADALALPYRDAFDHVLANPPFNDASHRASPNEDRARSHRGDDLAPWIKAMRRAARAGGTLGLIARPAQLGPVLIEMGRGAGRIGVLPVQPRAQVAAHRVVVTAVKGARAPLALMPPLVLHEADGAFTARAAAIFAGENGGDDAGDGAGNSAEEARPARG